jgi:hypothetical protein
MFGLADDAVSARYFVVMSKEHLHLQLLPFVNTVKPLAAAC